MTRGTLGIGTVIQSNLKAHPTATGPHCQETGEEKWRLTCVFLPIPRSMSSLRGILFCFVFCFTGPAVAPEEHVSQPGDRWQMLAPRNSSMTALLLPDRFLSLCLASTFLSTTQLCKKQPDCLQVVGELLVQNASESLLLPS